jgi:hypothetical protein
MPLTNKKFAAMPIRTKIIAAIFYTCCLYGFREPVTIDPFAEIKKISDAYRQIPANAVAKLTMSYSFSEHNPDSVSQTDSMSASLQMLEGKFVLKMKDVVQVQDESSNVTIYPSDAIMYVQRRVDIRKTIFRFDLLDSLLVSKSIEQVVASEAGKQRKINFQFISESPFIELSIIYDTATYHLRSIKYSTKNTGSEAGFSQMSIAYSPVSLSANPDVNLFLTSSYFKRQNGLLKPIAPYENFELINSFDE